VFVLLPPSETKAPGGDGPALDLRTLAFPQLAPLREQLITALVDVCADPPAARRALGVTSSKDNDIAATAAMIDVLRDVGAEHAAGRPVLELVS